MNKIKVISMTSQRSGAPVANQFIIETETGTYFQSYSTVIAYKDNAGKITLDAESWDYSRTTAKYRNEFLNTTTDEIKAKIKDGSITLANLN